MNHRERPQSDIPTIVIRLGSDLLPAGHVWHDRRCSQAAPLVRDIPLSTVTPYEGLEPAALLHTQINST